MPLVRRERCFKGVDRGVERAIHRRHTAYTGAVAPLKKNGQQLLRSCSVIKSEPQVSGAAFLDADVTIGALNRREYLCFY